MLQIRDEKELALYFDPWEESLLNFVVNQIMAFSKSIQSICLIPHCFMGDAEKQVHDFCFT